ncbi:MAG: acyloxyacyl hydrolase [Bacteroidota bacterium]
MKNLIFIITLLTTGISYSQSKTSHIQADYFYGNLLKHNKDMAHMIKGHPNGFIVSWQNKVDGGELWNENYSYPEYGYAMSFTDYKSDILGKNIGAFGFRNFYFGDNRKNDVFLLKVGLGLAYSTTSFNRDENSRNVAIGSRFSIAIPFILNHKINNLYKGLGIQYGFSFFHYSNGNIKAPNNGINIFAANFGFNYQLDRPYNPSVEEKIIYKDRQIDKSVGLDIVLSGGINETENIGAGTFPFGVVTVYADKALNQRSKIQFGADFFASGFIKESIKFSNAQDNGVYHDPNDFYRLSILLGHELYIDKLSLVTQLGYYIYYPYDYEGRLYSRIGLKRYFGKRYFGILAVKAHSIKAEAIEFGIGITL